jgi:pyruvate,water dikinase
METENLNQKNVVWFKEVTKKDIEQVGGKNGSLGEMFSQLGEKGVSVPNGFITTADAYRYYLKFNGIDRKFEVLFKGLNIKDLKQLKRVSAQARNLIIKGEFPPDFRNQILEAYKELSAYYKTKNVTVAVRSSGTAEDLAGASFAGAHETYLNVDTPAELLDSVKKCISSLFLDRAIVYRVDKGFDVLKVALSVGVMKMVRSDLASAGIMFTLDTESGFRNVVLVSSIFGAGEMIVKGHVVADQFYVFKPSLKEGKYSIISKNLGKKDIKYIFAKKVGLKEVAVAPKDQARFSLTDAEIEKLAKWAVIIEEHYGNPQDIEWAKDGKSGELFIVQARPETIFSGKETKNVYEEYEVKTRALPITTGIAVGNKIGEGKVHIIPNVKQIGLFKKGEVLVTTMTDPDWVPIMRIASAIVTEEGTKTCHAAIVSRELGTPCIVGSKNATKVLKNNQLVTVDCTQGQEGRVFVGKVPYNKKEYDLGKIPELPTKIMLNVGTPDGAFKASFLPNDGVGLARVEFIFADKVKVHPLALINFVKLKDKKLKAQIENITAGYKDKKEFFVDKLAEGVATIAAAFYPKHVIVRFSDFKTNEYSALIGGKDYEPIESNPMIGWRGASRYYDPRFEPAFAMECQAIKKVREAMGLDNVWTMIPFCRTVEEGKKVIDVMEKNGLKRGENGLKVIVMCEIPANVILADQFLEVFDGMSIGSNDLTQLTLGLDRDAGALAYIGNENNDAVKVLVAQAIKVCKAKGKYIGICGQAPSDYPEFAEFVMQEGIETMSLNPDSVMKTIIKLGGLQK